MVGPLECSGLLWQLSHPLALASDAPAFSQDAGLRLGSDPTARIGFACIPDKAMGFFALPVSVDGWEYGCFLRTGASEWLLLEGSLWLSEPDPQTAGEDWLLTQAPYPGGALAGSAVNIRLGGADAGGSVAVGCSVGEHVPPGIFCHVRAAAHSGGAAGGVLLGVASGSCMLPNGSGLRDRIVASAHAAIDIPVIRATARYALSFGQTGCLSGPFLPTRERLGLALDREMRLQRGETVAWCLSGEKALACHADGSAQETSSADFSIRFIGVGSAGRAGIGCSSSGGPEINARLQWTPFPSTEATVSAGVSWPRLLCALASLTAQARRNAGGYALWVKAGVEKMPVAVAGGDILKHLSLSVGWSTSGGAMTEEEGSRFEP